MTDSQMATAIAQAVAVALGKKSLNASNRKVRKGKKGKKGRAQLTETDRAAYMAANDAECVKAFTAAGYQDVQPRVNVMTYNKFIEAGRKVRKGEKGTRVGPFALFHVNQTDAITLVDQPAVNTVAA